MQMELTYQEAGKPLPKAYESEEGLIAFTLERMDEGIMEKLVEQRLRVADTDTWDSWAEFTSDVKKVHDIIQAVAQNLSNRSKNGKNEKDKEEGKSMRDRSRSARPMTRTGAGGASAERTTDHRPLVKNHFKNKVWHKAPYDRCTMPPFGEDGSTICVYLWWGLTCKFCAEGNCQARSGVARLKDQSAIQSMRDTDDTYKEWLTYKEECSGETASGTSNRKTTKQKPDKQKAGLQSSVDKMQNQLKQTVEDMAKLTRQNRKLRSTLRSKSPHPSRRRKQASGSEDEEESEEEEEESEEESEESANESESTEPMSSEEEGSSRRSRGRSSSRRTAKGGASKGRGKGRAKSKSRSKFMMSVQRTGIEGEEDSFEEKGEIEENFASSEKLLVEIDNEYKAVLDATRDTLLDKIKKLKEVQGMATDWFDETGSLGVENQVEGAIGALEIQILEMDVKLQKLAESQREREQKGEEESKENDPPNEGEQNEMFWHHRCLESVECILMHQEEVLKQEFERECAKEWNRRKLERVYASVDGEGFGRDGIYREDRNGCMEMYVGEFDDDPPGERSMRELWEEYVGGEMPEDLLKKERLDKELMQIGKHEHLKQLDESREFERSGPTFRMMRRGKPSTNKKKSKKGTFFRRGGAGRTRNLPLLSVKSRIPMKQREKRNRRVKNSMKSKKKKARKTS